MIKIFERFENDAWTVLVDASAKQVFDFQEKRDLELDVYPLMKTCYVVCDTNGLQQIRREFNVLHESEGSAELHKRKHTFTLKMKKDYLSFVRHKRLMTLIKGFKHYGIYSLKCLRSDREDDYVMTYELSLESYDQRASVLEYLRGVFKSGFEREGLTLEKYKFEA